MPCVLVSRTASITSVKPSVAGKPMTWQHEKTVPGGEISPPGINYGVCDFGNPVLYLSSIKDRKSSASSTQEGSYFTFFMIAPHAGQISYGSGKEDMHREQTYPSARNRCVR